MPTSRIGITTIIDGLIDIIDKNLVSRTNLASNALTGQILVNVENSFHFSDNQEVVLVDYGYNDPASPHYNKYEYAVISEVNNTHWVTLQSPIVDPSGGWLVSNGGFIQKTIGYSPLYSDRIFYGDREVIATEEMAITVEPLSQSNEWMYIQGGLNREYRVSIMIYGKDINTEQGMKVLNLYTDNLQDVLSRSYHIDIDDFSVPLLNNVAAGTNTVVIEDNADNRSYFVPSMTLPDRMSYDIQDNLGTEHHLFVTSVNTPGDGNMYIEVGPATHQYSPYLPLLPLTRSYSVAEYGIFIRQGRYFWDSRVDGIDYGTVQKGSAFIRAARLNWYCKEIVDYTFPQQTVRNEYFTQEPGIESSSSSSSF